MNNLNEFLQPVNSPVGQPSPFDLAMDFQIHNDRDIIGNAQVSSIRANKISTGTVTVGVNLGTAAGSAYLLLDGANNRIMVNDGSNDRILIGYQSGGF